MPPSLLPRYHLCVPKLSMTLCLPRLLHLLLWRVPGAEHYAVWPRILHFHPLLCALLLGLGSGLYRARHIYPWCQVQFKAEGGTETGEGSRAKPDIGATCRNLTEGIGRAGLHIPRSEKMEGSGDCGCGRAKGLSTRGSQVELKGWQAVQDGAHASGEQEGCKTS